MYPVYVRVILRGVGFCLTVTPLMVTLYLTAKPIVPFVFYSRAGDRAVRRRLRTICTTIGAVGGLGYAVWSATPSYPAFIVPLMSFFLLVLLSMWVLNVLTYIRVQGRLRDPPEMRQSNGGELARLLKVWQKKAIVQSLALTLPFLVFGQYLVDVLTHLEDHPMSLHDKEYAPADEITKRAQSGLLTTWVFTTWVCAQLYSSWRSREFLTAGNKKPASTETKTPSSFQNASVAGTKMSSVQSTCTTGMSSAPPSVIPVSRASMVTAPGDTSADYTSAAYSFDDFTSAGDSSFYASDETIGAHDSPSYPSDEATSGVRSSVTINVASHSNDGVHEAPAAIHLESHSYGNDRASPLPAGALASHGAFSPPSACHTPGEFSQPPGGARRTPPPGGLVSTAPNSLDVDVTLSMDKAPRITIQVNGQDVGAAR